MAEKIGIREVRNCNRLNWILVLEQIANETQSDFNHEERREV
jgi:hypothetical protein